MRDIFNNFVNGSSTEKLAIISNFSTILGVSVATFVAGPFLRKFADMPFVISDFIIAILFYFICLWGAMSFIYVAFTDIIRLIRKNKPTLIIYRIIGLFLVSWLALIIFPYAKYYTGNLFNNNYLLSTPAKNAVQDIAYKITKNGDISILKGQVTFSKGINGSNYTLIVYSRSESGFYKIYRLTNYDYSFNLSDSGQFTIPLDTQYQKINEPVIIAYRKSDWSLFEQLSSNNGFPTNMSQLPSSETEKLEAFVYIPKI